MDFLDEILITENEINNKICELGQKITHDYRDKNLLLVGILKGSIMFFTDLSRKINIYDNCNLDFIQVSSYIGMVRSNKINILKDLSTEDITNFDVLIIEDILESG